MRPLENQKGLIIDPALKYITINLYSFTSAIYIYYQPTNLASDLDEMSKKNKNIFSYNGPLHDLNTEIQKSNIKANDLDELDNEVAMISRKSPKNQMIQGNEESKVNVQDEADDYNTRNFNSIPRNYDDSKNNMIEEVKQKQDSGIVQAKTQSPQSESRSI